MRGTERSCDNGEKEYMKKASRQKKQRVNERRKEWESSRGIIHLPASRASSGGVAAAGGVDRDVERARDSAVERRDRVVKRAERRHARRQSEGGSTGDSGN